MALMDSPLFLGFATLEGLCEEEVLERTLYVLAAGKRTTIPHSSMGTVHEVLTIQGLLPTRVVGYCRISLGYVETVNGTPLDRERAAATLRRVEAAKRIVTGWLSARGFRIVEATFAPPAELTLLEGNAACLVYDREADTFHGPDPERAS